MTKHEMYIDFLSCENKYKKKFYHIVKETSELKPRDKDRLTIFSHYDKDGIIDDYVIDFIKELSRYSDVIFISTADRISLNQCKCIEHLTRQIVIKENIGYDFGAWKTGLIILGENVKEYPYGIVFVNDSVYGPLFSLNDFFEKTILYDILSMTDSYEVHYHLQSYFVYMSQKAFWTDIVKNFWDNLSIIEEKDIVIFSYEVGFYSSVVKQPDLKIGSYIRSDDFNFKKNMTILKWKELLEKGFPFIKKAMFIHRTNDTIISNHLLFISSYSENMSNIIRKHLIRTNQFQPILKGNL